MAVLSVIRTFSISAMLAEDGVEDGDENYEAEETDEKLDDALLNLELAQEAAGTNRRTTHPGHELGTYGEDDQAVSITLEFLKRRSLAGILPDANTVDDSSGDGVMIDSSGARVRTTTALLQVQALNGDLQGRAFGQYVPEIARCEDYIMSELSDTAIGRQLLRLRAFIRGEEDTGELVIRVPLENVMPVTRGFIVDMAVNAHPQTEKIQASGLSVTV